MNDSSAPEPASGAARLQAWIPLRVLGPFQVWGPLLAVAGSVLAVVSASRTAGPWAGATAGAASLALLAGAMAVRNFRELRRLRTNESSLRRDLARLQMIVDSIPGRVGLWDLELRNRFANLAFREWFDRQPEEMTGMPLREILGEDVFQSCRSHVETALEGRKTSFETELPGPGASRQALVDLVPYQEDGVVAGFFSLARDTSREREAIRAIEEAREQAEQSSRAKTEFVANMSHEIRTPLNAVLGMAQLLDKTSVTPNQRKYLDMIRQSGRSLLGIIDDILDFSKIEAGRMQLESMDFLLDDVLENVANIASMNAAGKEIEVSIAVDPGVPAQLRGDSLRLQQILVNLLGNAIKFTTRGEVALTVEVLSSDEQSHRIGFRVRDTGIGMTDEQLRRLFQPFSQVDSSNSRRYGGTGLGLTISKKIVEMMGGQIGVRSMARIGTEFFLSLPFPNLQIPEPGAQHLGLRPLSLVALERHPATQASLEAIAARWGWKISFADSLKECLAQLERRETLDPVDAVIVDGTTSGWDDRRSIRELRSACQREIPVIKTVRNAVESPADEGIRILEGILVKPIVPQALLKILKNRLGNPPRDEVESSLPPGPAGDRRRRLKGVRLLLVEDNAFNQVVAMETLQALGAQVELAEHGKAAIERLRKTPDGFDLVLMDLQMPVMDGYAATRAIRDELGLGSLPVVAMTAGVQPSDRDRCKQAGMDDFIPKPFEVEDLVRVVRRHLSLGEGPAKPEPAPRTAQVFQPDHLLASLGRSADSLGTVRSLVKQFLSTVPNSVRVGKECAHRGDLEEALRAFHNLKSGAATLGALSLSGTAQKIESALLESERRNLKPLFDELAAEFEKVVAEAERWLLVHSAESSLDTKSDPPSSRSDLPSSRTESEF